MSDRCFAVIAVMTVILGASLFCGEAETSLEQQCAKYASPAACRKL
jgi:hypothetical protein